MVNPNDFPTVSYDVLEPVVNFLRHVDIQQLFDEKSLFQTIRQTRNLQLNLLQSSFEFAKWIHICQKCSVKRYLEIGVLNGGSLICVSEILRRTNALEEIVGLDINLRSGVETYAKNTPWVKLLKIDTASLAFENVLTVEQFDAVMIDGNHKFLNCVSDIVHCMAISPLIAVHDIKHIKGVAKAWNAIRCDATFSETMKSWEISHDGPGIGVIASNDIWKLAVEAPNSMR